MIVNMIDDKLENSVSKTFIDEHLQKFSDLELDKHSSFDEEINCSFQTQQEVQNFIESSKLRQVTVRDGNTFYYKFEDSDVEEVFDIDVKHSFSKSDSWLYDKLIRVSDVFPNALPASVSNKQTSFFICLVIALVFRGRGFKV